MILARASRYCLAACLAFASANAHADVLELDRNGARWVAGGSAVPVADPQTGALQPIAEIDGETLFLPDTAIANASQQASIVPARYAPFIAELAQRFDLSPALLEAVVWQESRWRHNSVSSAGALGLAQLMPGTARELGVDPRDPYENLEGGARYLREQLDRFDGDLEKALAAYNAGPGRVMRADGIPNIRETQQYVAAIMARLSNHSRTSQR